MNTSMIDPPPRLPNGVLAGLAAGVLIGVLIALIVVPDQADPDVTIAGVPGAPSGSARVPPVTASRQLPTSPAAPGPGVPADSSSARATPTTALPGGSAPSAPTEAPPPDRPPRPDGSNAPAAPAVSPGDTRGVSADTVRIGLGYVDLSGVENLGPAFDIGDPQEQWEAILDGWRRQGRLPVHGRDIEPSFRKYLPFTSEQQRAACTGFVNDDKVMAVIANSTFTEGAECVAREFRTPIVTGDAAREEQFARAYPYLFSLSASIEQQARNLVHHADRIGLFEEVAKLGVVYDGGSVEQQQVLDTAVIAMADDLGVQVLAQATSSGQEGGLAARRFADEDVRAVWLFTDGGFQDTAEAIGYRPTYLASDWLNGTNDTSTSNYDPEHYAGSVGYTSFRVAEASAGIPLSDAQERCLQNYERYSGEEVPRPSPEAGQPVVIAYILIGCDLSEILYQGLLAAGPDLGMDTFVAGVETFASPSLVFVASGNLSPERRGATDQSMDIRWHPDCRCWRANGPFMPFYVP